MAQLEDIKVNERQHWAFHMTNTFIQYHLKMIGQAVTDIRAFHNPDFLLGPANKEADL